MTDLTPQELNDLNALALPIFYDDVGERKFDGAVDGDGQGADVGADDISSLPNTHYLNVHDMPRADKLYGQVKFSDVVADELFGGSSERNLNRPVFGFAHDYLLGAGSRVLRGRLSLAQLPVDSRKDVMDVWQGLERLSLPFDDCVMAVHGRVMDYLLVRGNRELATWIRWADKAGLGFAGNSSEFAHGLVMPKVSYKAGFALLRTWQTVVAVLHDLDVSAKAGFDDALEIMDLLYELVDNFNRLSHWQKAAVPIGVRFLVSAFNEKGKGGEFDGFNSGVLRLRFGVKTADGANAVELTAPFVGLLKTGSAMTLGFMSQMGHDRRMLGVPYMVTGLSKMVGQSWAVDGEFDAKGADLSVGDDVLQGFNDGAGLFLDDGLNDGGADELANIGGSDVGKASKDVLAGAVGNVLGSLDDVGLLQAVHDGVDLTHELSHELDDVLSTLADVVDIGDDALADMAFDKDGLLDELMADETDVNAWVNGLFSDGLNDELMAGKHGDITGVECFDDGWQMVDGLPKLSKGHDWQNGLGQTDNGGVNGLLGLLHDGGIGQLSDIDIKAVVAEKALFDNYWQWYQKAVDYGYLKKRIKIVAQDEFGFGVNYPLQTWVNLGALQARLSGSTEIKMTILLSQLQREYWQSVFYYWLPACVITKSGTKAFLDKMFGFGHLGKDLQDGEIVGQAWLKYGLTAYAMPTAFAKVETLWSAINAFYWSVFVKWLSVEKLTDRLWVDTKMGLSGVYGIDDEWFGCLKAGECVYGRLLKLAGESSFKDLVKDFGGTDKLVSAWLSIGGLNGLGQFTADVRECYAKSFNYSKQFGYWHDGGVMWLGFCLAWANEYEPDLLDEFWSFDEWIRLPFAVPDNYLMPYRVPSLDELLKGVDVVKVSHLMNGVEQKSVYCPLVGDVLIG